jgi:calcium/calmodulin-dependent protein kinase I
MQTMLTARSTVAKGDDGAWSLDPDGKGTSAKIWNMKGADCEEADAWVTKVTKALDIAKWLQHYKIGKVLGEGANGVVRICSDTRSGTEFAIKEVQIKSPRHRQRAAEEVEMLREVSDMVNHPNLVKIFKVFEEDVKMSMVLQKLDCELYERIVDKGVYTELDAAKVMRELISGLDALHQHNILHLDIKPENVLYESTAEDSPIRITDFGLSRVWQTQQQDGSMDRSGSGPSVPSDPHFVCGTVGYIAPEIIMSNLMTPAADVFSAGVILFILLVGYPPFHSDTQKETLAKAARGQVVYHEEDWEGISSVAKNLVIRMLEVRMLDCYWIARLLVRPLGSLAQ